MEVYIQKAQIKFKSSTLENEIKMGLFQTRKRQPQNMETTADFKVYQVKPFQPAQRCTKVVKTAESQPLALV